METHRVESLPQAWWLVEGSRLEQARLFLPLFVSFLVLIGGMLLIFQGLVSYGAYTAGLLGLYAWLGLFTVAVCAWTARIERQSLAEIGFTPKGWVPALGTSVLLGGLAAVGVIGIARDVNPSGYILPALVSGLFETVYFYGWLPARLRKQLGFGMTVLVTSLLYATYHIGYFGLSPQGIDSFWLSFGLYVLVGLITVAARQYFRSAWVLWPGFITINTIYDYARVGFPVAATVQAGTGAILVAVLVVLGVIAWRSSGREPVRGLPEPAADWRPVARTMWSAERARLIWTSVILLGLLWFGLNVRYIVNDPIDLDVTRLLGPAGPALMTRSPVQENMLRFGLGAYLLLPLAALAWWPSVGRKTGEPHGQTQVRVMVWVGWTVLAILVIAALCAPLVLAGPGGDASALVRYLWIVLATVLYALLNGALALILSASMQDLHWLWFVAFLGYIFIFDWWMVYPLFSQYAHVGLPSTNDPQAVGVWMGEIWRRATNLYACIPHYQYYIALVITYTTSLFEQQIFLPALTTLATDALCFWFLALAYLRERPVYSGEPGKALA